jgi:hypothetical protein
MSMSPESKRPAEKASSTEKASSAANGISLLRYSGEHRAIEDWLQAEAGFKPKAVIPGEKGNRRTA